MIIHLARLCGDPHGGGSTRRAALRFFTRRADVPTHRLAPLGHFNGNSPAGALRRAGGIPALGDLCTAAGVNGTETRAVHSPGFPSI